MVQEIKGETVDEDLQNLDPAFLQGMNLHNLVRIPPLINRRIEQISLQFLLAQVREFEMEAGGSHLGILALADDTLAGLNDNDS